MSQKVRTAVIPAAGLGTRFLPASKAVPKEMLPIVDVPTIQLVVEEAAAAGIEQVVVVNGRNKSAIEDHFDHAYELENILESRGKSEMVAELRKIANIAQIVSVRQKQALGLGHAIACAHPAVGDEPVAILLADDLFDGGENPGIGQLIKAYGECGGAGVVAVMEVPEGQEHKYGIVDGELDERGFWKVTGLVEKPAPGTAPSRLAIIGRYVLPPEIWPALETTKTGHGGGIQLTDAMVSLIDGPGLYAIPIEGNRYDAGDKIGFLHANLAFALKRDDLREPLLALMKKMLDEA
ncbi:MAG: UTP--glucose-1-phosphate uridylyltransferase GalU [Kofleriaceae bacterium]|nr:UTP--glucose-1-phosphate uridylyltransferase GalU [Kofleriaceae bacterium]